MPKFYIPSLLLLIAAVFLKWPVVHAQGRIDSILLEQAFKDKNNAVPDSMFRSWYSRSVDRQRGKSDNDTLQFVYQVYSRFMRDFVHKKMAGKKDIQVNRNYFFIQDKIHFLFIDSLSFEDLHYYFNGIFQHYGLLRYRDSIATYIWKTIAGSRKAGTLKTIDPFIRI